MITRVRPPAVAGHWYPDDPEDLRREIDAYVSAAEVDPLPRHPRALIAPHAGLTYSGPVAAFAFKAARAAAYGTAVLVGPSHFVPFRGVSLWPDGAFQTPFGPVRVDAELAADIERECREVVWNEAAHAREHSLEMQLPFVAHLLGTPAIVPLVMGHQTRATALALGEALARAIAARTPAQTLHQRTPGTPSDDGNDGEPTGPRPGEVLLIASSDLSHYEDARRAAQMDHAVLTHVRELDPEGLMATLEREPRHACGGGPMVSVLHASRLLGAREARVLQYADSGDVSGDKSAVVGYMAAAVW